MVQGFAAGCYAVLPDAPHAGAVKGPELGSQRAQRAAASFPGCPVDLSTKRCVYDDGEHGRRGPAG